MKSLVPLTMVKRQATIHILRRELVVHCAEGRYVYVTNLSNISLYEFIPKDIVIKDADLLRIMYVLYKYALKIGDSRELRKFQCLPKPILPSIREAFFSSKEMLNFKLATIHCLVNGYIPNKHLDRIQKAFKKFDLTKDDAIMYTLLFHNGDLSEIEKRLEEVEDGFVISYESVRSELQAPQLAKMRQHAISHAYRKLRFIYEGNRLAMDDMINELILRAVQSYYWVRPYFNKAHALNYALSSMQKCALNIIRHYTDPCRARVVNDGGGFTNVITDFGSYVPSDNFTEDAMLLYIDAIRGKLVA